MDGWAPLYLIFLLACAAIGFIVFYVLWGLFQGENLTTKIAQLRRELFQDNPLAEDLRSRLEETRDLVLAKSGEIMGLHGSEQALDRERGGLEKRLAEATTALAVGEGDLKGLRSGLREKDDLASEMNCRLAAAESKLAARGRDIDDVQRRLAERAPQIVDLERRLASADKAADARTDERAALGRNLSGLQDQLEKAGEELAGLRRAEEETRQAVQRERDARDALLKEEAELIGKLAGLQRALDQTEARLPGLKTEIRETEKAIGTLEPRCKELLRKGKDARSRLDKARKRQAAFQERLEKAVEARDEDVLPAEAVRMEEERIERSRQELASRSREADALVELLPALRRSVDDAEREARRLEAVLAERDEALRLVREQLGDKRAARRRLGDELDRLRGEADVAVADADHLRRQVEELESLLARGEASESLRAEMDSLIREIEANRVRLAERRRRTELQRRKRDEIRSDAHRARADLDVLETQAGEISGRLGDARKELKASESATQKARDQVKAAEDKLRAKEARVREIRDKIRADDARIASLTSREQGIRRTLRERRAALEEEAETALRLEALKTGQVAAGGKAASKEHGHQEGESGQIGAS